MTRRGVAFDLLFHDLPGMSFQLSPSLLLLHTLAVSCRSHDPDGTHWACPSCRVLSGRKQTAETARKASQMRDSVV